MVNNSFWTDSIDQERVGVLPCRARCHALWWSMGQHVTLISYTPYIIHMWCSCTAPLFKFVLMNCNHNSWVTVFSTLPSSRSTAAHPPVVEWFSIFADRSHMLFQTLDSDSHPIHDLSQEAFHGVGTAGSNSDDWWGPTLLWAGLSPCEQLHHDIQDCSLLRDCAFAGQSFDGLALVICGLYRLLFQWLATSHVGQMPCVLSWYTRALARYRPRGPCGLLDCIVRFTY